MGVRRNYRQGSTPNLYPPPREDKVDGERGVDGTAAAAAVCNVVLVGDAGVGKTALVNRAVHNKFAESPTRRTERRTTEWTFRVGGRRVRYRIADLSGSLRSLTDSSYGLLRNASVFLLCYKISDPRSLFSAVDSWCLDVATAAPGVPVILVGCQSDLRNDRAVLTTLSSSSGLAPVSADQALTVSQQSGCELYVETSARTCQRSAVSAFEVAGLVALGKISSSGNGGGSRFGSISSARKVPPPVPPRPDKRSPPLPPRPRRAYSQMALNRDAPATISSASSTPAKTFSSRTKSRPPLFSTRNSSASTLSLTTGGGFQNRTPRTQRRKQQPQAEKTVTIKCQRLTADKKYEEVEVEVPQPIYETLRFYNDKGGDDDAKQSKKRAFSQQEVTGGVGGVGAKSRRSLADKIRSLLFSSAKA